ncbi:MAG TPA: nucleotidyltransferase family protein [Bacteroidia bacterium]|jgi:predicted nucleotidyltransferase|nr:nucleotidyltransferase family protein [Bacteroidia bacterium]
MQEKVNTKSELIGLICRNGAEIKRYGVTKLGIFGSFARDEARTESDVDFFVEVLQEYKTLKNFYALKIYLQKLTGRNIELVTPQSLNKFIGKYILQEIEYVAFAA